VIKSRTLPVLAAIGLLIASGLARRRLLDDAGTARAVEEAAARLALTPESVGDWSGREAEVDHRGLDRAGVAGIIARRYENARTGRSATLVLLCGRPGPIAAHGPESCYPGVGFTPVAPAKRLEVPGSVLWAADFRNESPAVPRTLRILWTWSDHGPWSAPDNPRLRFAGAGVLYKAYVLHEDEAATAATGQDPARDLAAAVLPVLDVVIDPGR
jgi:Protein of unknown function (DUF3485)